MDGRVDRRKSFYVFSPCACGVIKSLKKNAFGAVSVFFCVQTLGCDELLAGYKKEWALYLGNRSIRYGTVRQIYMIHEALRPSIQHETPKGRWVVHRSYTARQIRNLAPQIPRGPIARK